MDGNGVLIPLGAFETATIRVRAAPSWTPITLRADKDAASGSVRLTWGGGTPPYTVQRAADAAFSLGVTTLVDEQAVATHDDPTLLDGSNAFYLVR